MLSDFQIVDVFTSSSLAGNQLAVLPNAQSKHDVSVEVVHGAAMGRRSEISATARVADNGALQSVEVGGPTRMWATGQIEVPESLLERP